jgi:hypothetical protein
MAFTFPSSPTTGDVHGQYTWNGYAWSITSSGGGGGGGGATGGGSDEWALEHDHTITTSYTVSTGKNVVSSGPMTVQESAVITVPQDSAWTVV